jgi:hypothetical protein
LRGAGGFSVSVVASGHAIFSAVIIRESG